MMTLASTVLPLLLFLCQLVHLSAQETKQGRDCSPFTCGGFRDVGFPFSSVHNPECGPCVMSCTGPGAKEAKVKFHEKGKWYPVAYFNYTARLIGIHDQDVLLHLNSNRCDLLSNFTEQVPPFLSIRVTETIELFKCKKSELHPISLPKFFDSFDNNTSCVDYDLYFYNDRNRHLPPLPYTLFNHCSVVHAPYSKQKFFDLGLKKDNHTSTWFADFTLLWQTSSECLNCTQKGGRCQSSRNGTFECGTFNCLDCNGNASQCVSTQNGTFACRTSKTPNEGISVGIKVGIALSAVGGLFVILMLVCWWKRVQLSTHSIVFLKREEKTQRVVEDFLKNYGTLAPKRYTYHDIKKITSSFKDKVGQGGYGVVYKGKLVDGRLVAVKLLDKAKGNGEEFMNEVASISRTSHVNVVSLLGFCFDGSNRALIYEFVPKGSLEKFIYDQSLLKEEPRLEWKTLYQISIGVARGLEYLHRGCSTRILHFDIKPHNILLDKDFTPKISDFGLAKICSRDESIISMLDARGTAGYIAPEVFCRSIGGVSHKSDVYSYGMMVLEIVGRRRNIDVGVDRTSEIYFPHWIYKRLVLDEDLKLHGVMSKDDEEITRKMLLVSLWCIQTSPIDRPTMTKVVEMLEGRIELLSTPPKPYLCSPTRDPISSSNT